MEAAGAREERRLLLARKVGGRVTADRHGRKNVGNGRKEIGRKKASEYTRCIPHAGRHENGTFNFSTPPVYPPCPPPLPTNTKNPPIV
jgi:hypothetical protein